MEEFRPKVSFQLEELTADGGLLNPIRHLARSSRDPSMPGDMVKEFEVVRVHIDLINTGRDFYQLTQPPQARLAWRQNL